MAKDLVFEQNARDKIKNGIDKLANAVKVTLGPRGRNVMLTKPFGSPVITKDGVSVAREVELKDPFENAGAHVVKEVASRTADVAGDGTTTATVLAQSIFNEGLKNVVAGASPIELKRGIDAAVIAVSNEIEQSAKKINTKEEISQVGAISANNEKDIGDIIAEAMDKVGKDGVISVDESPGADMTLTLVEGMSIDRGFISHHFMTNLETMEAVLENPLVLVYDRKISTVNDVKGAMEMAVQLGGRHLLIIADDVEGVALQVMVQNKLRGTLKSCAIKAPGYGEKRREMLIDIATLVGATMIDTSAGQKLDDLTPDHLGEAKKIVISKSTTTIIDGVGHPDDIKSRISQLKSQAESTTSDFDREKLNERIAKLCGGVAMINVGATTEAEMKEKKDRVEDALNATRAAIESGIVPGGGVALIRAAHSIDGLKLNGDRFLGAQIVKRACEEPLRQIVKNAGGMPDVIIERVKKEKGNVGYNAHTEVFEDLVKSGVIDPAKVTITALQNAASISGLLLTTDCIIADEQVIDEKNML